MEPNDVKKVRKFLEISCPVTRNEIASGTGLSRDEVAAILAAVVPTGEIIRGGAPQDNYATYTLRDKPTPVVSTESSISAESKWNDEQRARAIREFRAQHPEESVRPTPAPKITDADVQAAMDANAPKPLILSEDDRKWLEYTRTLKPANPQQFLK